MSAFTATRAQPCGSSIDCGGVQVGMRGAYVSLPSGPAPFCQPCKEQIEAAFGFEPAPAASPITQPVPVSTHPAAEPDPGIEPEGALSPEQLAVGQPGEALCACTRGAGSGFHNVGTLTDQRWVHTGCGLPAYAGQTPASPRDDRDTAAPPSETRPLVESPVDPFPDGVPADSDEWSTEPPADENYDPALANVADELAQLDAAEGREPRVVQSWDDVPERMRPASMQPPAPTACTCRRTTRSKYETDASGRRVHKTCRLPVDEPQQETATDDQPGAGPTAGTAEATADGVDPAAGQPGGGAGGAVRPGEGGEGGSGGAAQGDHGRAQAGGDDSEPGGNRSADPQPVPADAATGARGADVVAGHEVAAGAVPRDLQPVPQPQHDVEARAGQVAGLAAFWAQPIEDDEPEPPPATLAAFWAQPSGDDDDDDEPEPTATSPEPAVSADDAAQGVAAAWAHSPERDGDGRPVEAPDSDNYLGEFSVAELLAELGRRDEIGAAGTRAAGVLMVDEAHGVEWIKRVAP